MGDHGTATAAVADLLGVREPASGEEGPLQVREAASARPGDGSGPEAIPVPTFPS
ncbi:hypothetical protein SCATT_37530 [Streptantibioticus cattleyicolor NRRL 8057 = DSM 46488]|uniref:Uncharacterized protein n=1 Tax=Streptantibioticus cattleyicolor (strain ATCC 35852 / DSM 46488 / JCM 4925 / NBRC 14057 / NRRL 8057) TaxID=1003195 RepID=G8X2Z2_STREN|nr:hypothetical protein SCATT_37530 [Streptantibioticus cattleyicolor NRRL 8057 = DSM 46488]